MSNSLTLIATTVALAAGSASADDTKRLNWAGTLEFGVDAVVSSDTPGAALSDTYMTLDLSAEFAISDRVAIFAAITAESVTGAVDDRVFEDIGVYVAELGLRFDLDVALISAGKISPAFGIAWDAAPGFYGTALAEDYELSEAIGISAETAQGAAGSLSLAVFYADETRLSDSFGTRRGRNATANGGAGNTGTLNNVALHWRHAIGETKISASARLLKAGQGDPSDERGLALGVVHGLSNGIELVGEIARFTGFGGTSDDATYATLGASQAIGNWTWAASWARRDVTSTGRDDLVSVGLARTFANGMELGAGIARYDAAGLDDTLAGISLVIPLGG